MVMWSWYGSGGNGMAWLMKLELGLDFFFAQRDSMTPKAARSCEWSESWRFLEDHDLPVP
jgi:hypothetical protein